LGKLYIIGFGVACFSAGYFMNGLLLIQTEKPIKSKVTQVVPVIKNKSVLDLISTSAVEPTIDNLSPISITNSEQVLLDSELNKKITATKDLPKWLIDGKDSISKEDAETFLPKPYSDIVASSGGMMIDSLKQHHKDNIDYGWAVMMEQNISDFVYLHQKSLDIELQLVNCKLTTCELRVLEKEKYSWNFIADDLRIQEWYDFSSSASSGHTGEDGTYLLVMLDK